MSTARMHNHRHRWLPAEIIRTWYAPVVRIEVVQPSSVPHTCHDEGRTAVMSSHSKALQTASELGTSRSALTVKCPPKQPVKSSRVWT
jgi:hypothetical protein